MQTNTPNETKLAQAACYAIETYGVATGAGYYNVACTNLAECKKQTLTELKAEIDAQVP